MVYKHLTASNKYPFVVLNLEIPPHDVDVNVHPTKKEVRYKNPNQIFNFIYSAVEAGLANHVEKTQPQQSFYTQPEQEIENFVKPLYSSPENTFEDNNEFYVDKKTDTMYVSEDKFQTFEAPQQPQVTQNTIFTQVQHKEPEPTDNIIGQYHDTYILIDTEAGLEIIDQHIAEERYIYEKLKSEKNIISQMLLYLML